MGLFDKLREKIDSFAQQHLAPSDKQRAAMLHYCNTKKGKPIVKGGEYPRYMKYTYQIEVPELLQEIMVHEGYLFLDDSGNCHPSEQGLQLLDEYEWLFRVSRYNITIEEFESAYNQYPAPKPKANDIIWGILNKQVNDNIGKYGLTRCAYYNMHVLLEEESHHVDSLRLLLQAFWIDLSGYDNSGVQDSIYVTVAPAVIKGLYELRDYYDEKLLDGIQSLTPSSYISISTFKEILQRIFNNQEFSELLPVQK